MRPIPSLKFRTVRRMTLVLVATLLLAPAAIIVGQALYFRSGAYARRVAEDLAHGLGTRVSLGRIERLGREVRILHDLSIGGTPEAPLLTARRAELRREFWWVLRLSDARVSIRSRRSLEEFLAVPADEVEVALEARKAALDWRLGVAPPADHVSLGMSLGAWRVESAEAGKPGWSVACDVSHRAKDGHAVVTLRDVPAPVCQLAGLLPDLPVTAGSVSGTVRSRGSDDFASWPGQGEMRLRLTGLPLGPLAAHVGVPGVAVTADGAAESGVNERSPALRIEARQSGAGPTSLSVSALRRLCYVVDVEPPDVPDTAGAVRVSAFEFSVRVEGADRVVLAGGLEPAGTAILGMLDGETSPRPLLRLGRTTFTPAELAQRLTEIRAGRADRRPPPTTTQAASQPVTESASRPATGPGD
jgi:hypothetical protein